MVWFFQQVVNREEHSPHLRGWSQPSKVLWTDVCNQRVKQLKHSLQNALIRVCNGMFVTFFVFLNLKVLKVAF